MTPGGSAVKKRVLLRLLWLPIVLFGCASTPPLPPPVTASATDPVVISRLYDQYNQWRGVRYREGGLSKNGVDCSGFVYLTYRDQFRQPVPRTTERLASTGTQINPRQARAGDLVFFKTGWKQRHVGIYLKNGSFMHASTSRGVMISRLQNPYWADAFWMVRRLDHGGG